jgi:hypothetical protein
MLMPRAKDSLIPVLRQAPRRRIAQNQVSRRNLRWRAWYARHYKGKLENHTSGSLKFGAAWLHRGGVADAY